MHFTDCMENRLHSEGPPPREYILYIFSSWDFRRDTGKGAKTGGGTVDRGSG